MYTIKKFMGDDQYSWAVFRSKDVKGMRSPICDPYIEPVMSGMGRQEAAYQRDVLKKRETKV